MDARTEPIKQDIDTIRESMTGKMEQIESKIKGTVEDTTESLKRGLDVKYQVGEHPWAALGTALLAGYALGSMGSSSSSPSTYRYRNDFRYNDFRHNDARAGELMRYYGQNGQSSDWHSSQGNSDWQANQPASQYTSHQQTSQYSSPGTYNGGQTYQANQNQSSDGFLDQVMGQLGSELDTFKTAAISSLVSLIRDTMKQNLPSVYQEAERLRQGSSTQGSSPWNSPAQAGPSAANRSSTYDSGNTSQSYATKSTGTPLGSSGEESDYPSRSTYGASSSDSPSTSSRSNVGSTQGTTNSGAGEFYKEADISEGQTNRYERTPEIYPAGSSESDRPKSSQSEVGSNPNYEFIPPARHGEPDGRP